ncbi:hypothetical protein C8R43DRAFT_1208599 [Mycena crocata]|nr:hypothetical protein C8R43DRAFT_1208599 [Mycena crocata]
MDYPQTDIAPWLETLEDVPPTPPPKPSKTLRVPPHNSYSSPPSSHQGSMSRYYYPNSHRPFANLSVSTESFKLNDSIDDLGQTLMAPELDLAPSHDVEIASCLDRSEPQEPPSPPPKNGRTFHFPAKGSSGLFSRQRSGPSDSQSNLSVAETTNSAIVSTSTSAMHEPRDPCSFSPSPELRKTKSSMFSSLRKKVSKKNIRSDSGNIDKSKHPSLRPPPLNSSSLVSFLPVPSPPQTPRFKRPKKKPSQQDEVPPLPSIQPPDPGEQEIKLDTHFDEMDGIIDRTILSNGDNDASSPSSGVASSQSHSHSDSSQFGSPLKFNNPFSPNKDVAEHGRASVARASDCAADHTTQQGPTPLKRDLPTVPLSAFSNAHISAGVMPPPMLPFKRPRATSPVDSHQTCVASDSAAKRTGVLAAVRTSTAAVAELQNWCTEPNYRHRLYNTVPGCTSVRQQCCPPPAAYYNTDDTIRKSKICQIANEAWMFAKRATVTDWAQVAGKYPRANEHDIDMRSRTVGCYFWAGWDAREQNATDDIRGRVRVRRRTCEVPVAQVVSGPNRIRAESGRTGLAAFEQRAGLSTFRTYAVNSGDGADRGDRRERCGEESTSATDDVNTNRGALQHLQA